MTATPAQFAPLRSYLAARAGFTDAELDTVRGVFAHRMLAAGDLLQRGGQPATDAAFVTRGCLRSYVLDEKGREHIVQFAPEDWWLSDTTSLASGEPSPYFFEAIEATEVLLIRPAGHQKLVTSVPGYAASFQTGLQRHAAAKDRRIAGSLSGSAKERYLAFLDAYPGIVQRVPQWMLASYLGVSPETVSRIRRKLADTHRSRRETD